MKLAFSGQARYADFDDGYALYASRSKKGEPMDKPMYHRVIKEYCLSLRAKLLAEGMIDIPELGTITAARITRKAQYRGTKFIGYGQIDWKTGQYDGRLKTFGIVFLPYMKKKQSIRSYGFVANRNLFKEMKKLFNGGSSWGLLEYKEEMI